MEEGNTDIYSTKEKEIENEEERARGGREGGRTGGAGRERERGRFGIEKEDYLKLGRGVWYDDGAHREPS